MTKLRVADFALVARDESPNFWALLEPWHCRQSLLELWLQWMKTEMLGGATFVC